MEGQTIVSIIITILLVIAFYLNYKAPKGKHSN
jgi:hypothetical protein